jgi:hypothetical protein
MAKNSDIIRQCYVTNLTDVVKKYQDNWMCDETWVRVISARYPDVINSIGDSSSIIGDDSADERGGMKAVEHRRRLSKDGGQNGREGNAITDEKTAVGGVGSSGE